MAVGCAAEVASGLKEGVVAFAEPLTALFFKALRDKEGEVRRNAIYGLGCLCESAGAAMAPYVPEHHPFAFATNPLTGAV